MMNVWLTLIGMAIVTYAVRALPLLAFTGKPGPQLERVLRYVPPAIFAALIVPTLIAPDRSVVLGAELYAGLFGVLVAFVTRNMAVTIVLGLAAFALLRAVGVN